MPQSSQTDKALPLPKVTKVNAGKYATGSASITNASPPHQRDLRSSWIHRMPVTFGHVERFVAGGGYDDASLWTDTLESPSLSSMSHHRGWSTEEKKILTIAYPLAWVQDWKGSSRPMMGRDFDRAYFLIGASYENSGIKVSDTLCSESFVPHPALGAPLTWFVKHSPTEEMRAAAKRAQQPYSAWQAKNTKVAVIQSTLFDLEE